MAEEGGFKVTDRRGGSDRVERPEAPPAASAAPPGSIATGPSTEETSRPGPDRAGPDLHSVLMMFASSAVIALGNAPDPMTGERRVDLAQAQDAIDVLLLLRDKTRGNRTEQESRVLDDVLYDLQLRFVRAAGEARRS